ncbi:hypothetical protein [Cellulosimicrobium cellulans]|uniref:hypothetical protein n=1 Tax=Cellulosimicrobium cellulans TaxID=1710 RepID=UPI0008492A7A|nr:hypothetical protein [Cellulosimicrobium cellulans]
MLQRIYTAAQEGGEALDGFARVANMSATDFAKAFREDPIRALDAFSQGLNTVEASGGNVVSTLSDLGIKSQEEQRVLCSSRRPATCSPTRSTGRPWRGRTTLHSTRRYAQQLHSCARCTR